MNASTLREAALRASTLNGGNLPSGTLREPLRGTPVAYGGKPSRSAGLTARDWLLLTIDPFP
ncbi:hypothetical protein [Calothrix sp. NIES-2098]|uniref:hypothetical protein n=1 Tax=Calothrix sp. NIES-2098 TaxID=1954171 RepID=UPI0030DA1BE4